MKDIQNNTLNLDDLDLTLVRELKQNARVSYLSLATKLGISHPTVRRRLNKLIDRGVVKITAVPVFPMLGYRTVLILALKAPPEMVNTLAGQLTALNRIGYLWVTAGYYNIVAVALYRSHEEYMTTFPEEFGSIREKVIIDTMWVVKIFKGDWTHLLDNNVGDVPSRLHSSPSALDLSVIEGLGKLPRASAKEIAANIGASLPSVRSSLRRVLSERMVLVTSVTSSAIFGDTVRGITLIKVHPSEMKCLTDTLENYPFVKRMFVVFGSFNCIVLTSFQDSSQMSDFLAQDLGIMPGVLGYESMVALKSQKGSFGPMTEDRVGNTELPG